jgi:hypothetical protein
MLLNPYTSIMIPTIEKMSFSDLLQEAIDWSRLSTSKFCLQSGFQPDRIYRAQSNDAKLSIETLELILTRFPELNGDRFIRRSGPLLLSGLCEPDKDFEATTQSLNGTIKYQLSVIEMKEKEIELLQNQLELYKDMLNKRP